MSCVTKRPCWHSACAETDGGPACRSICTTVRSCLSVCGSAERLCDIEQTDIEQAKPLSHGSHARHGRHVRLGASPRHRRRRQVRRGGATMIASVQREHAVSIDLELLAKMLRAMCRDTDAVMCDLLDMVCHGFADRGILPCA
mmetsp:Transcript_79591/g.202798  ORF Transcript_79591/g.202798 Transcript_79591/m.202798 type:complete len:143 (+) Transcript_79591:407-835(+)